MRGVFLSLEGCDGSGKTTHFDFICEELTERGFTVVQTRQPGGSEVAEQIRAAVLGTQYTEKVDPVVETMLYAASRRQVLKAVIEPALEEGKIVVSDRWSDSSFAYQGYGRGLWQEFSTIQDVAHCGFWPDKTLFFNITHEESMKRLEARKKAYNRLNLQNDDEFRKRCYEGYQAAIETAPDRFVVIDGMPPVYQIQRNLSDWISKVFVPEYAHLQRVI